MAKPNITMKSIHAVNCDQTVLRVLGTVKNNAGIGINVVVVSGEFVSESPFYFSIPRSNTNVLLTFTKDTLSPGLVFV